MSDFFCGIKLLPVEKESSNVAKENSCELHNTNSSLKRLRCIITIEQTPMSSIITSRSLTASEEFSTNPFMQGFCEYFLSIGKVVPASAAPKAICLRVSYNRSVALCRVPALKCKLSSDAQQSGCARCKCVCWK